MNTLLAINWGNTLNIVAFGIITVFLLLIVLVFVLTLFSKAITSKIKVIKKNGKAGTDKEIEYVDHQISINDSAAIGVALYLFYEDVHDKESEIITIKNIEKRYSPWSSKIYGLNNLVR